MKKILSLLMVFTALLLFNGCTSKIKYIHIKPPKLKVATNKKIKITYKKVDGGYFLTNKEFNKWLIWSKRAVKANWFLNYEVKEYNKWRKELLQRYGKDNSKKQ